MPLLGLVRQQEVNLQEWQTGHELEQPLSKPQVDSQRGEQNLEIDEPAEKARQKVKDYYEEKIGDLEQHSQIYDLLINNLEELIERRRQAAAGLPLAPIKSLIGEIKQSTNLLREQIKGELEKPLFKQRIVRLSNALEIKKHVKLIDQARLRLNQNFKEHFRQVESFKQGFEPLAKECVKQRDLTDMTTMQTEMYDALRSAGTPEEKARAAAMNVLSIEQVATKEDLAKLETKMTERLAKLEIEMIERFGKLESSMLKIESSMLRSMMVMSGIVVGSVIGSVSIAVAIILKYS